MNSILIKAGSGVRVETNLKLEVGRQIDNILLQTRGILSKTERKNEVLELKFR